MVDSLAPLQALVDAWHDDFAWRFPARIVATGELKAYLLQLLYLLDGVKQQKFAWAPGGQPVFRLSDVAHALGTSRRAALAGVLRSTLATPHLFWQRFGAGAREPGLTLGGVVILIALIPPWRYRSRERQRWQEQRHALAMRILRAAGDSEDVGAWVNSLVDPVQASAAAIH